MRKQILKPINIIFILIETLFSVSIIYGLVYYLENYEIPLGQENSDSLFLAVMIPITVLIITLMISLFILTKINQRITNERFNFSNGLAYLIFVLSLSIILSYAILKVLEIFIDIGKIQETINPVFYYLYIFIIFHISILGFNIGLRSINYNSTEKQNDLEK